MEVLVCVKRVPDTGEKITLTGDGRCVDTTNLEFAISPHEECAVEEAIRLVEAHGGEATVLSLGPPQTTEQLREAIAKGVHKAILLETESEAWEWEWDPGAVAHSIVEAVRDRGFDVLLFGNECADSGNYQVGPRVATLLDLPCVTGIKALEIQDGKAIAKRETADGWAVFEVDLPAVFTVKEGINTPRHPSLRGIMAAKRAPLEQLRPRRRAPQLAHLSLRQPQEARGETQILGEGPAAVPKLVELIQELGVV